MPYILSCQSITNLDKVIVFELDGERLIRRLVRTAIRLHEEISVSSPTGSKLANAQPGQKFEVSVKGTDSYLVGKVLEIKDSLTHAGAM